MANLVYLFLIFYQLNKILFMISSQFFISNLSLNYTHQYIRENMKNIDE